MKKQKKRKGTTRKLRQSLRAGSKNVKRRLIQTVGVCDICGNNKSLQLHHIYLIRHGFKTKLEHCCLLCANCHADFHHRWDRYLDVVFKEDPEANFLKIYEVLKKL